MKERRCARGTNHRCGTIPMAPTGMRRAHKRDMTPVVPPEVLAHVAVSHPIRRLSGLAVAGAALLLAAAPASAVPAISGADTDVWNAADPDPTYTITAASPRLRVYWQVPGIAFDDGRSPLRVRLDDLPDGTYRLIAREGLILNPVTAERTFRVDTTPPAIALTRPSPGAGGDDDDDDDGRRVDRFGQGSAVTADYRCDGAVTCTGTVPPGGAIDTSAPGTFTFTVRARDDAGNETVRQARYEVLPGPVTVLSPPVAVTPPAAVAAPAVRRVTRPRTLNAPRLKPRAGARVSSRPLLRWRAHSRARLYNVQVFRLRGTKATKVLSAFPRTTRLRVPAARLAPGARYVWRVWPYLAGGYPDRPLGLSYFDVGRKPATG